MRRITIPLALLLLTAASCASGGGRPDGVERPQIHIGVAGGTVFFGSGSSVPVTVEVEVTNRAKVPITLREVEVSSHAMVEWGLRSRRQLFNETIAPGETRTVTLFTTAVSYARYPSEPLSLRSFVDFEVNGKYFREIVFTRG